MSRDSELQPGETVLVTDGPFAQFTGPVYSIDRERHRVQLIVQIFGDDTRIDIPLDAVERAPNAGASPSSLGNSCLQPKASPQRQAR